MSLVMDDPHTTIDYDTIRLQGILILSIKGPTTGDIKLILSLEDKSPKGERKATQEIRIDNKETNLKLSDEIRLFDIAETDACAIQIQAKAVKRELKKMKWTRSELLSESFELHCSELRSKSRSSSGAVDITEYEPGLLKVGDKYHILVRLLFRMRNPTVKEIQDRISILRKNFEQSKNIIDQLGPLGSLFDVVLKYGKPISEFNGFAKLAFALADEMFKSIKAHDETSQRAYQLLYRMQSILEAIQSSEALRNDSGQLCKAVDQILLLAQEFIRLVEQCVTERAVGILRSIAWSSKTADRLGQLEQQLNRVIEVFSLAFAVETWENTQFLVKAQRDHSRQEDLKKICEWLSPLDFVVVQKDTYARRQRGTGEWFFATQEFCNWENGESRLLWCSGIRKTIISSAVINRLRSNTTSDHICVLSVYCRHDERQMQTLGNLFGSLWKQIVTHRGFVSKSLTEFYDRHMRSQEHPEVHALIDALKNELESFRIAYIVVDGLDECSENVMQRFAKGLRSLGEKTNVRLFVASRPYPDIRSILGSFQSISLSAEEKDMELFIREQFELAPVDIVRMIEASSIITQEEIIKVVIAKANGMFLLVRLHLGNLLALESAQAIKDELDVLVELGSTTDDAASDPVLEEAYNQSMDRIRKHRLACRAEKLLEWVLYAQTPLLVQSLQYAIAIKDNDTALNENALTDADALVSACAGLITLKPLHDEDGRGRKQHGKFMKRYNAMHLVHETAAVYLRHILRPALDCQTSIMCTCLNLLSFPFGYLNDLGLRGYSRFGTPLGPQGHLLYYACCNWMLHAISADPSSDSVVKFLTRIKDQWDFIRVLMELHSGKNYTRSLDWERCWYPTTHLLMYFGLYDILDRELAKEESIIRAVDTQERTLLAFSVLSGNMRITKALLRRPSPRLNWRDLDGKTPLAYAVDDRPLGREAIELLLSQPQVNPDYWAVDWSQFFGVFESSIRSRLWAFQATQPLLEQEDADGRNELLSFCCRHLGYDMKLENVMARLILEDTDADLSVNCLEDKHECTALLWYAAECDCGFASSWYNHYDIIVSLVARGADPALCCYHHRSPLLCITERLVHRTASNDPYAESGVQSIFCFLLKTVQCDKFKFCPERFSEICKYLRDSESALTTIYISKCADWIMGCLDSAFTAKDGSSLLFPMMHSRASAGFPSQMSRGELSRKSQVDLIYSVLYRFTRLPISHHDSDSRKHPRLNEVDAVGASGSEDVVCFGDMRMPIGPVGIELSYKDRHGRSALTGALECESIPLVLLLLRSGTSATARDINLFLQQLPEHRKFPAHRGFPLRKSPAMVDVETLIMAQFIAKPRARDQNGRTVLSYAAESGNSDIVRLTLQTLNPDYGSSLTAPHAADLEVDEAGRSPFSYYVGDERTEWDDTIGSILFSEDELNRADKQSCTPLIHASKHGNDSGIEWLLQRNDIVLDCMDDEGRTALSHYAACGSSHKVTKLLMSRAEHLINQFDSHHRSPLSYAASNGDWSSNVLEELLTYSEIIIDEPDEQGRTPLSYAGSNGIRAIETLLTQTSVRRDFADKMGRTPLSYASEHAKDVIVKELLTQASVNPNTTDADGRTPLSYAASAAWATECVEILLARRDVQPNQPDNHGRTPLSYAAEHGLRRAVNALLRREDIQPLMEDEQGRTPFHYAVQNGDPVVIALLLMRASRDEILKFDDDGRSLLSHAAQDGRTRVVSVFLEHLSKADIDLKDKWGRTALSYAAEQGHKLVVCKFASLGKADINITDNIGRSPISYAASEGHKRVVDFLLRRKALLDQLDHDGHTPRYYAEQNGHQEILSLFDEYESDDQRSSEHRALLLHSKIEALKAEWAIEERELQLHRLASDLYP